MANEICETGETIHLELSPAMARVLAAAARSYKLGAAAAENEDAAAWDKKEG